MSCIPIENGIICIANTEIECRHCKFTFQGDDDLIQKRINKNKCSYTITTCPECGSKICITNDIYGNFVTWEWGKYEKNIT